MTSQKDQIQSLIADIEQVLGKGKPRTPWVKAADIEPQRQALVRAQAYLMSLQQSFEAPGGWGPVDPSTGQIAAPASPDPAAIGAPATDASAENVLQALLTEMKYLKSSALQPLRLEMDSLREERDNLNQEVKALADQRNQALTALNQVQLDQAQLAGSQSVGRMDIDEQQLNEFLQVLMSRLQERLTEQVTETLGQLESEHSAAMAKLTAATEIEILELKPTGQIEEMRQIQSRSDQLLANIDSTLQRMFETLQTNIDSYQISLNEGIENMHSLGRQGEVIVRSLVDHLTQQLGQTAPPEPAFYPARPTAFAESTEPVADTVSSLNEILPAGANTFIAEETEPEDLRSASISETASTTLASTTLENETGETDSPETDLTEIEAETVLASETSSSEATQLQEDLAESSTDENETDENETDESEANENETEVAPEAFIREDGTIDLDLLKLDIDRTEDDTALSRDDLMIDSAVADAQVAQTEAENIDSLEIEAKVKPTPEAAFLADLTFDDLVVDSALTPELTESEVSAPEVSVPDLIVESSLVNADLESPDASTQVSASPDTTIQDEADRDETDLERQDATPAPELAAILPDLGSDENDSDEDRPGESSESRPESAAGPDLPDPEALASDLTVQGDGIDDVLADDLVAVLEADSEAADKTALESIDGDLDPLASDLEEAIVFDESDTPPLPALDEASEPLESAFIPDQPSDEANDEGQNQPLKTDRETNLEETDVETVDSNAELDVLSGGTLSGDLWSEDTYSQPQFPPADSFEASLETLGLSEERSDSTERDEAEAALTQDVSTDEPNVGSTVPSQLTPDLPPVDFDDDLDFFPADPASSPSAELEDGGATLDDFTADVARLAGTIGVTSAAAGLTAAPETESVRPVDPTEPADSVSSESRAAESKAVEEMRAAQPPDADEGEDDPTGGEPADWFLGIDLGATGLSAVLINQSGDQVYPLCWNVAGDNESNRFRLPAVVQIDLHTENNPQLGIVGPAALQQNVPLLRNLKLMVKAGIPNGNSREPWMQWSDHTAIPLETLQVAITELLSTLQPDQMSCRAVGLKVSALRRALSDLKGVIVGYPTNWPDTYSFNIRESVLAAGLISSPDQVFFVEEAIAALLSALPAPEAAKDVPENQQPGLYNCNWSGGTIIISAGAILTETAVANLPADLEQLSYQDFSKRGYTYAGDGIDQDIICQLLHNPLPDSKEGEKGIGTAVDSIGRWESLGLSEIALPQPGEADRVTRHRLRQRLNDSPLGREAILTARELKMALQEEEEVEVELGDHTWVITRKDLETKVFLPYIQRINRQVNALLSKQNLATQGVKQVVCTGGSASLGVIARWLRQKFPNATIIQDTYTGEYSNSCSRVAYGLANLCNYPKVLDANRHQYNDYFLLLELLRILPEQPLPAGGILHLLEQRGINTQVCQAHVLALIEGHLPPGLVPTSGDRPLISAQSSDIATYRALSELPLFRKQGGQIYIADPQQGERLRTHLEGLLATKAQSLSEPMTPEALTASTGVQV